MKNIASIIIKILGILLFISSAFLIYGLILYKGIETYYIIMGIVFIIYINFVNILLLYKALKHKNKIKLMCSIIYSIIFIVIFTAVSFYLIKIYGSLDSMNKNEITYTTTLITKNAKETKIDKITSSTIGILSTEDDMEGYVLPMEVISEYSLDKSNEIIPYLTTIELMNDLYQEEIDYIFINGNYVDIFQVMEGYEKIGEETKTIHTHSKKVSKNTVEENPKGNNSKLLTEPFTIMLLGIDSNIDGLEKNAAFNGDTIMIVTFNPKTMQATMLSIPRDTYVPITCNGNSMQKINSSAWGGTTCVKNTVEKMTGLDIDYYVKINFKGVVELVDSLGGINVNVPYAFCEQDSNRRFGKYMVYVEKGNQKLNGEQALALARNRHTWSDKCDDKWTHGLRNDFVRGQNQQLVIEGIINKAKSIRNVNEATDLLDAISRNMDTNLSTEQMLSLYSVGKSLIFDGNNVLNIQKTKLTGYDYGFNIYEPSAKSYRYAFFHYKGSLKDIVTAMEINLGLKKATLIKEFAFDINTPYESIIIGNKSYNEARYPLVIDFKSYSLDKIKSWGNTNDIDIKIVDVDTNSEITDYSEYKYSSQKEVPRTPLFRLNSITIYAKKQVIIPETPIEVPVDEDIVEE